MGQTIGTTAWTEQTNGRLTPSERRALMRPLVRSLMGNIAGRARMAVRLHPGRRATIDEAALQPPDSKLAGDAAAAAVELLSPMLLHHSHRTYMWGAALAALERLPFDPELLFVAAMLHDTGLPTPTAGVDFTIASAALTRTFADKAGLSDAARGLVSDAICLHHTPGVTQAAGAEAYLLSAGAAVDVFGLRSWELPDTLRASVIEAWPRADFKRQFSALWRSEAKRVPKGRAWFLRRYAMSDVSIRIAPFRG